MPPKRRKGKPRHGRAPTGDKAANKNTNKAAAAVADRAAAKPAAKAAVKATAVAAAAEEAIGEALVYVKKVKAENYEAKAKLRAFEDGAAHAFRCLYDADREAAAECYDALADDVRERVWLEVDEDDTEFPDAKRQCVDSDSEGDAAVGSSEHDETSDEGDESDREYTQDEWDEWYRLHPSEDEDDEPESDASGSEDEEDEEDDRSGSDRD